MKLVYVKRDGMILDVFSTEGEARRAIEASGEEGLEMEVTKYTETKRGDLVEA